MQSIHRSVRATLARTALAALGLGATLAACDDPTGPGVDPQMVPFYYYDGEKIYLSVDGSRLTADLEVTGDTATLRAVAAQAGVQVDSVRPVALLGHWFIHLAPDTPGRKAEAAARQLRLDPRVRFASAVYRVRGTDCPLYMLNRLVVQFSATADAGAIRALNESTGVYGEVVDNLSGTRRYAYPAAMRATPLELAAHYYRQRIVDWAEGDRINACVRLDDHAVP